MHVFQHCINLLQGNNLSSKIASELVGVLMIEVCSLFLWVDNWTTTWLYHNRITRCWDKILRGYLFSKNQRSNILLVLLYSRKIRRLLPSSNECMTSNILRHFCHPQVFIQDKAPPVSAPIFAYAVGSIKRLEIQHGAWTQTDISNFIYYDDIDSMMW